MATPNFDAREIAVKRSLDTPLFNARWGEIRSTAFENLYYDFPNLRGNAEVQQLQDWYQRRLDDTLLLIRTRGACTDKNDWFVTIDAEGRLVRVGREDGGFWEIDMMRVQKTDPSNPEHPMIYDQPIQRTSQAEMMVPIRGVRESLPVNGILAHIVDSSGKTLLAAEQETTAPFLNQLVIRLGFLASRGKMDKVLKSPSPANNLADRNLLKVMTALDVTDPQQMIDKARWTKAMVAEDMNLTVEKDNMLVGFEVEHDSPTHASLVEDDTLFWATPLQVRAASWVLTNAHTLAVLKLVDDREALMAIK